MRPAIRGSTAICPRTPTAQPLLKPDYLRMVTPLEYRMLLLRNQAQISICLYILEILLVNLR